MEREQKKRGPREASVILPASWLSICPYRGVTEWFLVAQ